MTEAFGGGAEFVVVLPEALTGPDLAPALTAPGEPVAEEESR